MALDELIAKIDRLREMMEAHKTDLRQNEAMTRYALIDPLLAALGWDISDPSQVRPEYKTGTRRADYALLKADGKPSVFVEAKSLDTALAEGLDQGIIYGVKTGTPYFVVTNGREWAVYDVFQAVPIKDKRVGFFNVSGTASKAAFSALGLLWKPLLRDEVKPSPPVMLPEAETSHPERPGSSDPPGGAQPPTAVIPPKADTTARNWPDSVVPLDKFRVKKGATPPKRLFLPDDQQRDLRFWKSLLIEVASHLVKTGKLSSRGCPVKLPKATKNYLVHTQDVHASGIPFSMPHDLGGGLHLEGFVSRHEARKKALFLIGHCGEDPSRYGVESG